LLKEKSRKIPVGSKLQKQRRRKGGIIFSSKNSELFNRVLSLKREVVETSATGKRKINK
jgi:hypothetical protein